MPSSWHRFFPNLNRGCTPKFTENTMLLKLKSDVLTLDFDHTHLVARRCLPEMVKILSDSGSIDNQTVLKVQGLNLANCVSVCVELCNTLGYLFKAVALAEDYYGRYVVQMTSSTDIPVGSILE
jgi:hypothetical protein